MPPAKKLIPSFKLTRTFIHEKASLKSIMSSPHLLLKPARDLNQSLSFRASSATLFLSQHARNSLTDEETDPVDLRIANGLLQTDSPRIPKRRSSSNFIALNPPSCLSINNGGCSAEARPHDDRRTRHIISSNTWTSSSAEASEDGRSEDRTPFVEEYNRLAKKHCVQPIIPDEFIAVHVEQVVLSAKPGSWIMKKLLGRTSSVHVSNRKSEKHFRHKRSVSDMSLRARKDSLKGKDLVELVRLCGTSPLYLPVEYASCTLAVPTCFRATAQYLVQHAAASRGIFRIPGAHTTVNALYNYYASQDEEGESIYGTVRCPTLPEHIQYNVHDVASAFKKFLAGLPGGILGNTWLFEAILSIYSQLDAKAEAMRTKQSKVRARLIALAIATVAQRHRRELICAVMGLLSMIGRAAEIAPREDERGRPLPTSDLMGYGALGIVFGPLLLGDLLDSHDLRPAGPNGSMIFIPRSPSKSSKSKHRKTKVKHGSDTLLQDTDKIRTVNSITEMLITHWRDIVRHMKDLGAMKSAKYHHDFLREKSKAFAPNSPIELFTVRRPWDWDLERSSICNSNRSGSPTPTSRNPQIRNAEGYFKDTIAQHDAKLLVRKRMKRPRPMSSQILPGAKSMNFLTPPAEEVHGEERINEYAQDASSNVAQDDLRPKGSMGMRNIFPTIPSEAVKSSPENHVEVAAPKGSCPAECAVFLSKPETNDFCNTPVRGQDSLGLGQHSIGDGEATMAKAVTGEIRLYKSPSWQAKAPPFTSSQKDNENLSMQLHTTSPTRGDLEITQNQSDKFSHIPTGIVATRLRGIATGYVDLQSPSGPPRSFGADKVAAISERNHIPSKASCSSQTFTNFHRDPLTRVSLEEDIASLTSLAEVIKLQDEIAHQECSQDKELAKVCTESAKFIKPDCGISSSGISVSEICNEESSLKISCQKDVEKWAVTPQRSTTEPSIPRLIGGTSVKALAAKFGNAEIAAKQTPSPVRTPDSQAWRKSAAEKAIVATYTTNTSPVSMVRRRDMFDTSFNSVSSPSRMRTRTASSSSKVQKSASSILTKKSPSNSIIKEDFGPSRWPKLRSPGQISQRGNGLVRARSISTFNRSILPNLHCTGDGNASFTLARMSSEEYPNPRPIKQSKDTFPCGCPFKFLTGFPVPGKYSSSSSGVEIALEDQNTSMLCTQIKYLLKQLEIKADEIDQLKRQLMPKDCLDDRAKLFQVVEELKRELRLWRIRAEEAEHRVEILSLAAEEEVSKAI